MELTEGQWNARHYPRTEGPLSGASRAVHRVDYALRCRRYRGISKRGFRYIRRCQCVLNAGENQGVKGAIEAAGDAPVDCQQRAVSPARRGSTAHNRVWITVPEQATSGAISPANRCPVPIEYDRCRRCSVRNLPATFEQFRSSSSLPRKRLRLNCPPVISYLKRASKGHPSGRENHQTPRRTDNRKAVFSKRKRALCCGFPDCFIASDGQSHLSQ